MKNRMSLLDRILSRGLCAAALVCAATVVPVQAQPHASAAVSMLPVASVVVTASMAAGVSSASTDVGQVSAVPAALSVVGAVFTLKAVTASAKGTVYVLERASDGAQISLQVLGRVAGASAHAVGSLVVCSVIASGVVLSVAGEAIAFVPNAIGQALLHNERL